MKTEMLAQLLLGLIVHGMESILSSRSRLPAETSLTNSLGLIELFRFSSHKKKMSANGEKKKKKLV